MILKAFSIYDVKSEAYSPPFFQNTVGLAVRMFTEAANDPETRIAKYPTDFTLMEIGTFDDSSGTIKPHDANVPLGAALEYVHPEQPDLPWQTNKSDELQAPPIAK